MVQNWAVYSAAYVSTGWPLTAVDGADNVTAAGSESPVPIESAAPEAVVGQPEQQQQPLQQQMENMHERETTKEDVVVEEVVVEPDDMEQDMTRFSSTDIRTRKSALGRDRTGARTRTRGITRGAAATATTSETPATTILREPSHDCSPVRPIRSHRPGVRRLQGLSLRTQRTSHMGWMSGSPSRATGQPATTRGQANQWQTPCQQEGGPGTTPPPLGFRPLQERLSEEGQGGRRGRRSRRSQDKT